MSKVRDLGTINTEEVVAPNEHKNEAKRQLEKRWKDKPMHEKFTKILTELIGKRAGNG